MLADDMSQELREQPQVVSLAVVLVHGTFARDADWTREDGAVTAEIQRKCPYARVVPFSWSGANSPSARIKAGQALATVVKSIRAHGQSIWIVGHSHGGNVALYALRDPTVQDMVSGIAFLGTPFLHITRRAIDRFATTLSRTVSWLLFFPVYMPFGGLALIHLAYNWLGAVAGGLMLLFGNAGVVLLYLSFRKRICHFAADRLTTFLRNRQAKALVRLEQPPPQCPTFVSWVSRDEAGLLLRAIDAVTFAPWQLYGLATRVMVSAVFSFVGVFLAQMIYDDTLQNLDAQQYVFALVLGVPFFVVFAPWVIGLLSSLLRGLPVAFGYEGMFGTATLRMKPSSLPWWRNVSSIRIVTHVPTRDASGLRHSSFYNDTKLIGELVKWISEGPSAYINDASAAIEAKEAAEVQSRRLRGWLLPSLSAIAVMVACFWTTIESTKKASVPKEDLQPLPADLIPLGANLTTILEIDEAIVTKEEGLLSMRSRKPVVKDPNIIIGAGQTCVLVGRMTFSNWDSTINISLHDKAHPDFGKFSFDMDEPNHRKATYDFIDRRIHHVIWEWNSGQGTTVSFTRSITNRFTRDGTLLIRLWNNSDRASHVKGIVQMACGKR